MSVVGVVSAANANQEAQASSAQTAAPGFAEALRSSARPGEVVPEHTPLSGSEAAAALSQAWTARFGEPPTAKMLSILGAQWSLETGGGRAMMNFNFGGIKGTGPSGLSVRYKTVEGSGATETHITDRFRAYRTAAEGASDYLRLLEKHYPGALGMARAGDAAGFVRELKKSGYFTGSEALYTKIVGDLSSRAEKSGFDALGKGGPHALVSLATPVSPPAATDLAPSHVDEVRLEVMRLTHALDRSALGIIDAEDPSSAFAASSDRALGDALSDLRSMIDPALVPTLVPTLVPKLVPRGTR